MLGALLTSGLMILGALESTKHVSLRAQAIDTVVQLLRTARKASGQRGFEFAVSLKRLSIAGKRTRKNGDYIGQLFTSHGG
jgi:hypothetical protein